MSDTVWKHFNELMISVCSCSDADRPPALRPRHRETPELCPEHGRTLHRLDLCCRTHHGGKLPGNHSLIDHFKPDRSQRESRSTFSLVSVCNRSLVIAAQSLLFRLN